MSSDELIKPTDACGSNDCTQRPLLARHQHPNILMSGLVDEQDRGRVRRQLLETPRPVFAAHLTHESLFTGLGEFFVLLSDWVVITAPHSWNPRSLDYESAGPPSGAADEC